MSHNYKTRFTERQKLKDFGKMIFPQLEFPPEPTYAESDTDMPTKKRPKRSRKIDLRLKKYRKYRMLAKIANEKSTEFAENNVDMPKRKRGRPKGSKKVDLRLKKYMKSRTLVKTPKVEPPVTDFKDDISESANDATDLEDKYFFAPIQPEPITEPKVSPVRVPVKPGEKCKLCLICKKCTQYCNCFKFFKTDTIPAVKEPEPEEPFPEDEVYNFSVEDDSSYDEEASSVDPQANLLELGEPISNDGVYNFSVKDDSPNEEEASSADSQVNLPDTEENDSTPAEPETQSSNEPAPDPDYNEEEHYKSAITFLYRRWAQCSQHITEIIPQRERSTSN